MAQSFLAPPASPDDCSQYECSMSAESKPSAPTRIKHLVCGSMAVGSLVNSIARWEQNPPVPTDLVQIKQP